MQKHFSNSWVIVSGHTVIHSCGKIFKWIWQAKLSNFRPRWIRPFVKMSQGEYGDLEVWDYITYSKSYSKANWRHFLRIAAWKQTEHALDLVWIGLANNVRPFAIIAVISLIVFKTWLWLFLVELQHKLALCCQWSWWSPDGPSVNRHACDFGQKSR